MATPRQPLSYDVNQHSTDLTCTHCRRVIGHEQWCSAQNSNVQYAFQAVLYADCLSLHDRLILHALGVAWEASKR